MDIFIIKLIIYIFGCIVLGVRIIFTRGRPPRLIDLIAFTIVCITSWLGVILFLGGLNENNRRT